MSTHVDKSDAEAFADLLSNYAPGTSDDRYVRFIRDVLDYPVTETLERMAISLNTNEQTLAVGANGPGKSYAAALLGVTVLYTNAHVVVPITAGNGDTLKNSIWKPIKSIWRNSNLPGDYKDNDRSLHPGFDDEWFLECHSPRHPDDLEGDHNQNVVYIIEEADKPGVTSEHIDSARSTLGDDDHILVIANPPTDETNVVAELMQNPEWHRLQFPTWESRNARVDRGLTTKDKIGGVAGISKMQSDWAEYHDASWPGIDSVIEVSSPYLTPEGNPTTREWEAAKETAQNERVGRDGLYNPNVEAKENPAFREDLHLKWYKRRAGVMPTDGAEKWRPFTVADVEAAYNRPSDGSEYPETYAIDVARSADNTIGSGKHTDEIRIHYARQGTNHVQQKEDLTDILFDLNSPKIAVDAVGEGSGLADELDDRFAHVVRFSNGMNPREESEYYDAWAEALAKFGEFLDSGGSFNDKHLYQEAKVAARVVEFEAKSLRSRDGDVIKATSKSKIKDRLGHSPDYLDSALMANWVDMAESGKTVKRRKARATMHKGN